MLRASGKALDVSDAYEGTCDLCGQLMVRDGDDAWHPAAVTINSGIVCPPEPCGNPFDYDGWKQFYDSGLRPGRPGVEHFRDVGSSDGVGNRLQSEANDLPGSGV